MLAEILWLQIANRALLKGLSIVKHYKRREIILNLIFCKHRHTFLFLHPSIHLVVSTVVSGIPFARFPTVECVCKGYSFLLWHHSCSKKFQSRWKDHFLGVGLIVCIINLIWHAVCHWLPDVYDHCKGRRDNRSRPSRHQTIR